MKIHHGSHEKLESGIDQMKKYFNWGENPERYHPGRSTLNITICNSNDAT